MALPGVYLLAWNPMVLYSTWGNGHNDMVMVFWILLAALAVSGRHYTAAVLALLAGALVKFIPLLMLPTAVWLALNDLPGWRQRWRFLILTGIAGLVLVWLAYSPFWIGLETLSIERRSLLFTSSLPAMIFHLLKPELGKEPASHLVSMAAAGLTACFAIWRGWRANRNVRWDSFGEATFDILAFYLLVACLWFQQWYTLWLMGTAVILPHGYRLRFAVFFSLAVVSKQLLVGPFLFRPKTAFVQPKLEILLTLGVLSFPWLYWLVARFGPARQDIMHMRTAESGRRVNSQALPHPTHDI
jgi:hypothetical protein